MATNPTPAPEQPKARQYKVFLKNPADNPFMLQFCRSPLKRKIVRAGRRGGKSQPLTAKVYTPYGPVLMGDLKIGQQVLTPYGTIANVEDIFPQGEMDIYRVTFGDGTSTECTADHLWTICESRTDSNWKKRQRVVTTNALRTMATVVQTGHGTNRRPTIPPTQPVIFYERPVILDPYLLGVLLGDGGLTESVIFTCAEAYLLEKVRGLLPHGVSLRHKDRYDYLLTTGKGSTSNPVTNALRRLGLIGKHSHDKFIPDWYKYNSKEVRLKVIQGLLDTDGWVDHNGQPRLEQTSARLAEDFAEVIQSLGGLCKCHEKMGGYKVDGARKETRLVYGQSVLYHDPQELFTLPRKRQKIKAHAQPIRRYIHKVEPIGKAEAQCIKISDPRGLYLTDHLIATHNTTGASILALEAFLKGKRVLYAAPTLDQVEKFWTEVKLALQEPLAYKILYKNETKHIIQGKPIQENETADDFKKRNVARIRAKTAFNAETLRGDYADLLILDEYQLMDETAWTEVGAPMLIDNNGDVVFIYTPPSLESKSNSKAKDPQHAAKMFKQHKDDPLWLCIHFPSSANPHLSKEGLQEVAKNMTIMAYRQEILAEDIEEVPGALWTRKIIEDSRYRANFESGHLFGLPCDMRRIVVAIDPSGGNTTEVGIVAAGEGTDGHIYVLRDASMKATRPKEWATTAISLYYELLADRIIAERNYGGDMVKETLENVDQSVSYHDVNATRGKLVRAEPVLALFQQNRMHLVCSCGKPAGHCTEFAPLEEELVSYSAAPGQKSPNRLDAMVWCGIELTGFGALGLLDLFKSGKAAQIMARAPVPMTPLPKVAGASSMAAVATADQTPHCEKCDWKVLQLVAGPSHRCQNCGHQQPVPGHELPKPLGGRRISLQK